MKRILAVCCIVWMVVVLTTNTSCVKESSFLDDSSARLQFSCDTVTFDTVFATMGSTTKQLKVYNPYDVAIRFTSISLKDGRNSRFRLNVDGDTSMVVRDLTLAPHDSIFVFVQANINPNLSTEPFLVEDAIEFSFANTRQHVVLNAFGRNAIYHKPTNTIASAAIRYSVIDCANWDHTMPHVIMGYAVVDEGDELNLLAGDELYFGNDACLWVYEGGSLKVHGSQDRPVRFTSVRHDGWYDTLPGQWGYIWLSSGSIDNQIDHAVIENGFIGVLADTNVNANPTLRITNTKIYNQSHCGIMGQGAYIVGDNLLITSCGSALLGLQVGGRYRFSNSTFANYWRFGNRGSHGNFIINGGGSQSYALAVSNYYTYRDASGAVRIEVRDIESCEFRNCIISGTHTNNGSGEVMLAADERGQFNVVFDHCLVKSQESMLLSQNSILCEDAGFVSTDKMDFHLGPDSPALAAGSSAWVSIPYDLDGAPRGVPPAIGAYEPIVSR